VAENYNEGFAGKVERRLTDSPTVRAAYWRDLWPMSKRLHRRRSQEFTMEGVQVAGRPGQGPEGRKSPTGAQGQSSAGESGRRTKSPRSRSLMWN